jgi:hypothetical protein
VFGGNAEREKRLLLAQLRTVRLATHAQVNALHEDLLFVCAFPGASSTRALARRMLAEIGERLRHLPSSQRRPAEDSGIAASITRHVFPYSIVAWLARSARGDLEIDWRNFDEPSRLDGFVGLLLRDAEREAFDSGEFHDARVDSTGAPRGRAHRPRMADGSRVRVACNSRTPRRRMGRRRGPAAMEAWRFALVGDAQHFGRCADSASHEHASTGGGRHRGRRTPSGIHRAAFSGASATRRRRRSRGAGGSLSRSQRDELSEPDEIYWCDLGEGVALAVIGIARDQRLTLETNTGYLLFANGVADRLWRRDPVVPPG